MQKIASFSTDLAKSVKGATSEQDFTKKAQAVEARHNAANAAQQRVGTYAKQHCGISTGSGG
jgi:hypothetical protein